MTGAEGVLVPMEDAAALGGAIAGCSPTRRRAAALAAAGGSGSRRNSRAVRSSPSGARERLAAIAAGARGLPAPITSTSA